jgi:predicted outer membrane repeat protein
MWNRIALKKQSALTIGALIFSIMVLAGALQPARADSTVVGTGTPASCTEAALDTALAELYPGANAPGGVLSFNCGPNPHTIVLTSEKFLHDGTVIDGGSLITLSGGNSTRIFFVSQQARVELHHIRLTNGYAAGGGAIYAEPNFSGDYTSLLLDDVTLHNNNSTTFGGAIGAQHTALVVSNSRLTENTSNWDGGAISLNGGTLTLIASEVVSNTAQAVSSTGGGLNLWDATLDIQTSALRGNQSVLAAGGAISLRNSTGSIATSQIEQNIASNFGGGLYLTTNSDLSLSQVTFTKNTAANGGGIANDGSTVVITDTTLTSNSASNGGAMYNYNGQATLQKTTLTKNQAAYGGGIYNTQNAHLNLTDVTLSENTATSGGGGVYNGGYGMATLVRVTLAQNTGGDGGGLFNAFPASAFLTNVTLSGNQANFGGGVYNNNFLQLLNVTFAKNQSLGGGGGLLHNGGGGPFLVMINTIFTQNTGIAANSDQCLLYKAPDTQLFSLWSGVSCGSSTANGNLPNTDAKLAPLGFTGTGLPTELTRTHALLPGSPAEDGGTCGNSAPATDQRGVARPYGAACDIGAVEMAPIAHAIYLPLVIR